MGYSPWGHKELDMTEHLTQMRAILRMGVSFSWGSSHKSTEQQRNRGSLVLLAETWTVRQAEEWSSWDVGGIDHRRP